MGIMRHIVETAVGTHFGNRNVEKSVSRGNLYALEAELARLEREFHQAPAGWESVQLNSRIQEVKHLIYEERRRCR